MQLNGYVLAWMTVGDSIQVVHVSVGGECINALSKCLHRVCRKASGRPMDVLRRLVECRTMYEEAIRMPAHCTAQRVRNVSKRLSGSG